MFIARNASSRLRKSYGHCSTPSPLDRLILSPFLQAVQLYIHRTRSMRVRCEQEYSAKMHCKSCRSLGESADDDAMLLESSRSGMSWKSNLPMAIPWTDHLWKAPRPIWCLRALHQWLGLFGHRMAPSTMVVILYRLRTPQDQF
jgi:hypothetical protein